MKTSPDHIETPRLLLRPLLETDAPGMYALDADPEVHRFLGGNTVQSVEASAAIIRMVQQQYVDFGIGRWAVIDRATQDFIGWSGLKYELNSRSGERYYDLGYRLRQAYWGRGIASETAAIWVKYGFETLQVPEICAAAHVDNAGSNRVLRKLGFECAETFDYDGEPHNWYRLQRPE